MPVDSHGSGVIDDEECRTLLTRTGASGRVGRLAMDREGAPYVIPVNFSFHDELILLRLKPGFVAYNLDGATVTFEIDHVDPFSKRPGASRWRVRRDC